MIKNYASSCKSSKIHNCTIVGHALDDTRSENFQVHFFTLTPKIWLILKPKCKWSVHLMWFYMFSFPPWSLWLIWGSLSFGRNLGSKINIFCEKFYYAACDIRFYMDQVLITTLEHGMHNITSHKLDMSWYMTLNSGAWHLQGRRVP